MIAIIQHVSFEPPGLILDWFIENNHPFQVVKIYQNDPLPHPENIEGVILMGGSMNVHEENLYPWLIKEKAFIKDCIRLEKKVFAICLGAQLVANVMGANVQRNPALEIGWFPVTLAQKKLPNGLQNIFTDEFVTFHWHGDTFEVPDNGFAFAASEACLNQGFVFGDNVLVMQFHLELKESGFDDLIANCADELLSESVFVQSATEIKEGFKIIQDNKIILYKLLTAFFKQ